MSFTNSKGIEYILVATKGYGRIELNLAWYRVADAEAKFKGKIVTCEASVVGEAVVCGVQGQRLWFDYLSSGIEASWSEKEFALIATV